jgi:hypothetical protein
VAQVLVALEIKHRQALALRPAFPNSIGESSAGAAAHIVEARGSSQIPGAEGFHDEAQLQGLEDYSSSLTVLRNPFLYHHLVAVLLLRSSAKQTSPYRPVKLQVPAVQKVHLLPLAGKQRT